MKKAIFAVIIVLFLSASCIVYVPTDVNREPRPRDYPQADVGDYGETSLSYFYDYLSPHGAWVHFSPHGYVWVPRHMGYRWRPYTMGHWAWTDYGWTWVSEEEWGWACFHYGRWGFDDDIGWFWVPGTVWAPAWVVWRSGPSYFGWAPVPPGIEFSLGYGFSSREFDVPHHHWIFVESRYFMDRRLDSYIFPFERNLTVIRYTELHQNIVVRNNRVFNEGIDVDTVRRATRQRISRQTIEDDRRPGPVRDELNRVRIYRPDIKESKESAPKRFVSRDEARKDLDQAKIWDPKTPQGEDTSVIRKKFDQETRVMERSHLEDLRRLRDKYDVQENGVRDPSEKNKIKKERDVAVEDLKKRHDQERRALSERQQKDEEQVKKRIIKKPDKSDRGER
ncbi:MAG: hypothetical protein NTU60_14285 [Candidatus Aminicenantes bacterium]|nr:hypothetical protein [Candidatus Aminicenantes bacterium]